MFRDWVGDIDPKEVNGAKQLTYYNITSSKDKALYQQNYNEYLNKIRQCINIPQYIVTNKRIVLP